MDENGFDDLGLILLRRLLTIGGDGFSGVDGLDDVGVVAKVHVVVRDGKNNGLETMAHLSSGLVVNDAVVINDVAIDATIAAQLGDHVRRDTT